MKLKEIYEELMSISKNIGITVRKDSGNFRSGYCHIDGNEFIILNRSNSIETLTRALASGISIHSGNIFIKPAIREYIDKELTNSLDKKNYNLEVNY